MILVGDIGGTRTRLALAERRGDGWEMTRLSEFPTGADTNALIRRYLAGAGSPALETAAFCGAGPLSADGSIRLTNNADVLLEPGSLALAAGVSRAILVNDFAAIAHAIPRLPATAFRACGGGAAVPDAPRVVIGPGTGLGIAILAPARGGWAVIPGDGGHADLAPVDDEQLAVWKKLRAEHGRVSAETVLSGPGLERLHGALAPGRRRSAAELAEAAWRGEPEALQVLCLFTRWLGSVAGNLALTAGAQGGIYLAGGIIPAWGDRFDAALFRRAFEDKAPYRDWLRGIPSFVISKEQPGLHGLAALAEQHD
jgi:glucokinase